jgi:hypothetical protein
LAAIKAERDRRRKELEIERKKALIQKRIYESTIDHLKGKLDQRSSWWEQNKGLLGFAIGTTVGMAIVVGIVYALTGGKSPVTTNTHITRTLP